MASFHFIYLFFLFLFYFAWVTLYAQVLHIYSFIRHIFINFTLKLPSDRLPSVLLWWPEYFKANQPWSALCVCSVLLSKKRAVNVMLSFAFTEYLKYFLHSCILWNQKIQLPGNWGSILFLIYMQWHAQDICWNAVFRVSLNQTLGAMPRTANISAYRLCKDLSLVQYVHVMYIYLLWLL